MLPCRSTLSIPDSLPSVGAGGGYHGVDMRTPGAGGLSVFRKQDRDFGLRIGTAGDGMDLVTFKHRAVVRNDHADRVEQRIDRAIAACGDGLFLAIDLQRQDRALRRSEEHTSELQSLMRTSYAVFCLKKKKKVKTIIR